MPFLNLDHHITINKETIDSANLCDRFTDEDLLKIGAHVKECFDRDVQSRTSWSERSESAMDLAMQVYKSKSFPWPNCSSVAFPLITIAALQFHSRAYPAIISGRNVVKARVIGPDPTGELQQRANRISKHMSWQLLEQDRNWEEEMDRALISVPIVGTAWKKSYYSASMGHNVSELVLAKDFVLDYYAKNVDTCLCKTHIVPFTRNEIHERIARKTFRDISEEEWYEADAVPLTLPQDYRADDRAGERVSGSDYNTPFTLLEQHCWLDLDDDGYAEPYIVTIESQSQAVLRIVCRFDREGDVIRNGDEIVKINATEYFTKIPFVPSPDGGIMDIGFGTLLGPINESVNTAINQMFDAATLSNTAGGFLGRGAKIRGGVYTFSPFSWQRVDSTGDDLRKNIFPMPTNQASPVLFQLLQLLIDYTNRISGATDMLTGANPGQNTTSQNANTMVEQGQKIYSAIFKRIWRAMKEEFRKLYNLNGIHLPISSLWGSGGKILREDYTGSGTDVVPVADPTITSQAMRMQKLTLLAQRAATTPGYNTVAVEKQLLEAMDVDDIELVYPGPDPNKPPQPPVQVMVEQLKVQFGMQRLQQQKLEFVMKLLQQERMNGALIAQAEANAFKLMEQGKTEPGKQQVNAFNAAIEAMRAQNDHSTNMITQLLKSMEVSNESTDEDAQSVKSAIATAANGGGNGVQGMAPAPGDQAVPGVGAPQPNGPDGSMG